MSGRKAAKGGATVAPTPAPPVLDSQQMLQQINQRLEDLNRSAAKAADGKSGEDGLHQMRRSQIQETLSKIDSAEEKLSRMIDLYLNELGARTILEKEVEAWKSKFMKSDTVREKLENLCRELQRRNEELRNISMEQHKQQTELKTRFESSLQDIQTQLQKHTEDRLKTVDENEKLKEKLTQLLKFESIREEHFNQQIKTKELESKLLEAKLRQQVEFAAVETRKAKKAQDQLEKLMATECTLRSQLTGYAEKFEQVQATLTKSNELFSTFKSEMEKMSKHMKKLEKDKQALEKKYNQSQLSLIQLYEERTSDRHTIDRSKRQMEILHSLCRKHEEERKLVKDKLRLLLGEPATATSSSLAALEALGPESAAQHSAELRDLLATTERDLAAMATQQHAATATTTSTTSTGTGTGEGAESQASTTVAATTAPAGSELSISPAAPAAATSAAAPAPTAVADKATLEQLLFAMPEPTPAPAATAPMPAAAAAATATPAPAAASSSAASKRSKKKKKKAGKGTDAAAAAGAGAGAGSGQADGASDTVEAHICLG